MKRFITVSSLVAVATASSCIDRVDLGGTSAFGEGGEGGADVPLGGSAPNGARPNGGSSRGGARAGGGTGARSGGGRSGSGGVAGSLGGTGTVGGGTPGGAGIGIAGDLVAAGAGGAIASAGAGGSVVTGNPDLPCGTPGAQACVACPTLGDENQLVTCLLDADGEPVAESFTATVMVTGIADETDDDFNSLCSGAGIASSATGAKLFTLLSEDDRRFTLVLLVPALPPNFIVVGRPLELEVAARPPAVPLVDYVDQTVRVSSMGAPFFFFAVSTNAPVPELEGSRLSITDEGLLCHEDFDFGCERVHRKTRVSIDGDAATFDPYQTKGLARYRVLVEDAHRFVTVADDPCDFPSLVQVAGFIGLRP